MQMHPMRKVGDAALVSMSNPQNKDIFYKLLFQHFFDPIRVRIFLFQWIQALSRSGLK